MSEKIEYITKPYKKAEVEKILNPLIKKWFFTRFKSFSLPQLHGVMEIHKRNNILISAPTGATKTLTGFLSILNELVDSAEKKILEDKVYAIYISPLKALSYDIEVNLKTPLKEIEKIYGGDLGISVMTRTGDTSQKEKAQMRKKAPHILLTTPESLAIMMASKKFKEKLKGVQWVITDEIHSLAENKRGTNFSLALERLEKLSPGFTRVGLSATVSPIEEVAKYLVGYEKSKPRKCKIVEIKFLKKTDLKLVLPVKNLIETEFMIKHKALYKKMHDLIKKHRTTLIFTNTRSATERVVHNLKDMYPKYYNDNNIGAHHGSLSKDVRRKLEDDLREGKVKCVVCSTSLELGIDIGYVDLVICLGSPKSVARFLQRSGRAGHRLHETIKGRIVAMNRDDMVECSTLLKCAKESKIDDIHIPTNALDLLPQHIIGLVMENYELPLKEAYELTKNAYPYRSLDYGDFMKVIHLLAGKYMDLESRHIYSKIWFDEDTRTIRAKGKMTRVIYMTNLGTIPEESYVTVKIKDQIIGKLDEPFLERLKPGDVFVLAGKTYQFRYTNGMTAQVTASVDRPPTVPNWISEMLPLSFDLAMQIGRFRRLVEDKLKHDYEKEDILEFIKGWVYCDDKNAEQIYNYFNEQFLVSKIPHDKRIVIELYRDENQKYAVFHTMFGRRVNDCLSRALAFVIGKMEKRDVEVAINDNGFYLAHSTNINYMKAFRMLEPTIFREIVEKSIEKSQLMVRRFRHAATRSLMILRNYKGRRKRVNRQQFSSKLLLKAVRDLDPDFPVLKETKREILEDVMDVENTLKVLNMIKNKKIKVKELSSDIPSPFSLGLLSQGISEMIKIEDKDEFLKRMHSYILAKIELMKRKGKNNR